MSLSTAQFQTLITAVEQLTVGVDDATGDNTVTHSTYFPAIDLVAIGADTIVVGNFALDPTTHVIDLCDSLVTAGGGAVSLDGKKIYALLARAKSTNANAISLKKGASQGYEFVANDAWQVSLKANQIFAMCPLATAVTIVSDINDKIDMAGTGEQSVDIVIVAGDA
jgi:hypothetical protein